MAVGILPKVDEDKGPWMCGIPRNGPHLMKQESQNMFGLVRWVGCIYDALVLVGMVFTLQGLLEGLHTSQWELGGTVNSFIKKE